MELELKITCTCHLAKITICCQTPLVAPIAPKICKGVFNTLNPNFPSDLLSDHSSNTSCQSASQPAAWWTGQVSFYNSTVYSLVPISHQMCWMMMVPPIIDYLNSGHTSETVQ